jgi:hypothetical protein
MSRCSQSCNFLKSSQLMLAVLLFNLLLGCAELGFSDSSSNAQISTASELVNDARLANFEDGSPLRQSPAAAINPADIRPGSTTATEVTAVLQGASVAPSLASASSTPSAELAAINLVTLGAQTNDTNANLAPSAPGQIVLASARQATVAPNRDSLFLGTSVGNTVEFTEPLGLRRTNFPVQMGRYFAFSEYKAGVNVSVDGVNLETQVDIKNRWPDGSIKFAVFAFVVPKIEANAKVTLSFDSVAASVPPVQTTKSPVAEFLEIGDAEFDVTVVQNKVKIKASTLANALQPKFWTRGNIASTFTLVDHSAARLFDFGETNLRALRPSFQVTVWHQLKLAKIRYTLEATNVDAFEDSTYSVKLLSNKFGESASVILSEDQVEHPVATRWTRSTWVGADIKPLSIKHNIKYLSRTGVLPNYDPTQIIAEPYISALSTDFATKSSRLFAAGFWTQSMPAPGGRAEIAMFPQWAVEAAISGDYRLLAILEKQAELAAAWPMHLREGQSNRKFDKAGADALGSPISLYARPNLQISIANGYWNSAYIPVVDRINFGTKIKPNSWVPDGSHQPSAYLIPYILTGDPWFLEQMQFWASWGAFLAMPTPTNGFYGRGPVNTSGQLSGDIRSQAWVFRNRVAAAVFSVDASKEKQYFTELTESAITIAEAIRDVRGGGKETTAEWKWGETIGRNSFYPNLGISPLRDWHAGYSGYVTAASVEFDPSRPLEKATPPWQMAFMLLSLDHAKQLGFRTDRLIEWTAPFFTAPLKKSSTANLIGIYVLPSVAANPSRNLRTWDEVLAQYKDPEYARKFVDNWLNSPDGYPLMMTSVFATLADQTTDGAENWQWITQNWRNRRKTPVTTRWSIMPREK